eukprot:CAMPEP_0206472664 /NCGR_PEP_ID=MMETSP0324_2-20121206/32353_1 /ASSEMBLY_ACC=CAM_ASM_000836 /TAXON_ID=2866 /ORGANISM="Crypthecodinium cohnii, Strain Seligo" /LENGTH=76 /DNA_ID=CAMNT_0053947343 /DNA_START=554 /DNA_END=780 /DNA_ORIENTATION=-
MVARMVQLVLVLLCQPGAPPTRRQTKSAQGTGCTHKPAVLRECSHQNENEHDNDDNNKDCDEKQQQSTRKEPHLAG